MTKRDTSAALVLPTVQDPTRFWERNGLKARSAVKYRHWVNRYLADCERKQTSPLWRGIAGLVGRTTTP